MNRKTVYACLAAFLVLLGGAGLYLGYKGYKKYKGKQNRELRCVATLGEAREGFDKEQFKKSVLTDGTLDFVIEKNGLLAAWSVQDAEAAKTRIREKFIVTIEAGKVKASYQDKDKALAEGVLQTILQRFYEMQRPAAATPPPAGKQ